MLKRLLFILFICLLGVQTGFGQARYLPKFMRKMLFETDSSRAASIIPLPVLNSAPETGIEFGGSILYSFYTDTIHRDTHVSNAFAFATITTKGQNRFGLSTSRWLSQNLYHYSASLGYINFPSDFYGIGNATHLADAERIGEKRVKLNFGAEKLVTKDIYVGFVVGALTYRSSSEETNGIFETDPLIQNREGGDNLFIGPSFIFDSRDNNTYTNTGFQLLSSYAFYKGIFGNNGYDGGLFAIEMMQYNRLSKKLNLAFDVDDTNLIGTQEPFYLLPALGSDELMRGYYNGRYRDKNYVACQAELRYRITQRVGLNFFGGTGTVFHDVFTFNELKPNYGGGLRYFFDVEKGLDVRMDYAFGEQRPGEPRQSGFYIGLGEAF